METSPKRRREASPPPTSKRVTRKERDGLLCRVPWQLVMFSHYVFCVQLLLLTGTKREHTKKNRM